MVASFTDAWIETKEWQKEMLPKGSHLLQMRGLKLNVTDLIKYTCVASFTDAWIETFIAGIPSAR